MHSKWKESKKAIGGLEDKCQMVFRVPVLNWQEMARVARDRWTSFNSSHIKPLSLKDTLENLCLSFFLSRSISIVILLLWSFLFQFYSSICCANVCSKWVFFCWITDRKTHSYSPPVLVCFPTIYYWLKFWIQDPTFYLANTIASFVWSARDTKKEAKELLGCWLFLFAFKYDI